MSDAPSARPVEIARAGQHDVLIKWNDGRETVFPARFLRLACPCAACVEEMTGVRILKAESVPPDVHPLSIHPVGRYAIQIQWSDGHGSGIYTWERLDLLSRQVVVGQKPD
ncbi:MAG: DUF971 domain-containing protein [Candidatus Zixiibacteriota bacterium]